MKTTLIATATATALVLGLLAFTGQSDYTEATRSQLEYCEMVKAGHWPDYEGKYNAWCKPN
jgi:hypothetical protein